MSTKFVEFFSNAAYATWAQTVIIVCGVLVAVVAMRHTDQTASVTNSMLFSQRYFLEKPSVSNVSLALRTKQFEIVQQAKTKISGYNDENERQAGWENVFRIARPLVAENIRNDPELKAKYEAGYDFFTSLFICLETEACDKVTATRMLAVEAKGFYNATCPYMEYLEAKYGHDEESPRFFDFLVGVAGFKDLKSDYFCREKVRAYLPEATTHVGKRRRRHL
jgi:hypothetical protein